MIKTSWEQWLRWSSDGYTMLPCIGCYPFGDAVASWKPAFRAGSRHAFVLESGKSGRYTYLGLSPVSSIRGWGSDCTVEENGITRKWNLPPLEAVQKWMAPYQAPRVPQTPDFTGGCVGFWGYDIVRFLEKLPNLARNDLSLPDYCFLRMEEVWIVDHREKKLYCAVHVPLDRVLPESGSGTYEQKLRKTYDAAARRVEAMKRQWDRMTGKSEEAEKREAFYRSLVSKDRLQLNVETFEGLTTHFPKADFVAAVGKIQDYIRSGDVFQVNLSLRQSRRLYAAPEEIYEWLRLFNPSPYMGLLKCGDFQLVSASPELLVKTAEGEIRTRPIAGTRRRGMNPQEDRRLAEELRRNEKERAEHIMLVDLLRNDLGRVSGYGTVRVTDLMEIEYYSHVMHLVSEVRGRLGKGRNLYDVIAAVFPGGTITGAPKIRTMEIIEELEPFRRGPYTGSLGWIDYCGDMEFNIIIRTLTVCGNIGHVQAGAGIVIDSVPRREYQESLNKAKALWKAVQYSEAWEAAQPAI